MKTIKNIIWQILNFLGIGGMIQLQLESGLKEDGWFKSYHKKQSINRKGEPIPWNNYAFLKFLEPRLQKTLEVFEYGSGNSTIWYAQRVKNIKAVENDQNWVSLVKPRLPNNAEVVYKMLNEAKDYVQEIKVEQKQYDMVIVDGRRRNDCAMFAFDYLKPEGIMILDNSERADYQPIFDFMQDKGYKHIEFWGMPPSVAQNTCTTIFYKEGNCFGI